MNADAAANCRRQMSEMRDLRQTLEDLRQEMEALRESSARAERKAATSANETEEARTLLEMAEKQKRQLEHELNQLRDSLNETVAQVKSYFFLSKKFVKLKGDFYYLAFTNFSSVVIWRDFLLNPFVFIDRSMGWRHPKEPWNLS